MQETVRLLRELFCKRVIRLQWKLYIIDEIKSESGLIMSRNKFGCANLSGILEIHILNLPTAVWRHTLRNAYDIPVHSYTQKNAYCRYINKHKPKEREKLLEIFFSYLFISNALTQMEFYVSRCISPCRDRFLDSLQSSYLSLCDIYRHIFTACGQMISICIKAK